MPSNTKPNMKPPDLALLTQMAGAGKLNLDIRRFDGPNAPYQAIHRMQEVTPDWVLNGLKGWLYDFAGGGRYRFQLSTDNSGVAPYEWDEGIPGVPRPPVTVAMADAQRPAVNVPMGYSAMGVPPQALSYPQGYGVPYSAPWQHQPPIMPYGYSPPFFPPQASGPTQREVDLQRQLDNEKHARELSEMERRFQDKQKEDALAATLRELKEHQTKPDVLGTIISSTLQAMATSQSSSMEAMKASMTHGQAPYLDKVLGFLLEQSSPRALGEMARTSSDVMSNAMAMMAEVAHMAKSADEPGTKAILMKVFEQLSSIGQKVVPALMKGQGQAAGPPISSPPPQNVLPAAQLVPASTSSSEASSASAPASSIEAPLELGAIRPWYERIRSMVASGQIDAEQGATAVADLLYRVHVWRMDSGDLEPALRRDWRGTLLRLFPEASDEWRAAFARCLPAAALKVGFKPELFGDGAKVDVPAQAQASPR